MNAINVGIDDVRFSFPSLFLDLKDLAEARNIEAAKLKNGLGLHEMSVCDVDEDIITLSAKALIDLVDANKLEPHEIGRIYVGTESSIDGSKPIASYLVGLLSQYYNSKGYEKDCVQNIDAVDMTFACIGAIDAMHNSLTYLLSEPNKKAIVIAADIANYDLSSSGEYTQGAGSAALLLSTEARLMQIPLQVGVATTCVHDFFKPLRYHALKDIATSQNEYTEEVIAIHRETPIFDGPLSNYTYQCRIKEAMDNLSNKRGVKTSLDSYDAFIFHLPYAYHGRRIINKLFLENMEKKGELDHFYNSLAVPKPNKNNLDPEEFKIENRKWKKAIVKSNEYQDMVSKKIEKSERLSSKTGNVYTASIFLALISDLYFALQNRIDRKEVLFFAYGSGSKSKVFTGKLGESWKNIVSKWQIDQQLESRKRIDFKTYEQLRLKKISTPVKSKKDGIFLESSGISETNRYSRNYVLT